uniref:Uncharacterized protein n=1 Tax=Arundo donax TaxID=35708 RepID=A0A0A9FTJ1_ARUDO
MNYTINFHFSDLRSTN